MKQENNILINIIGTGYDICVGEVSAPLDELFERISKEKKLSPHDFLFDEEFYKRNQIMKPGHTGVYKSWKDFNDTAVFRGANLTEAGQLEVWINKKRVRTYKFHELYDNATLFPIFNTEVEFLNQQMGSGTHLVVGYKEKGHLAKYVIKSDQFIPHELKVHIVEFAEASLVVKLFYKITYFGIALKSIKESTLITGTVAKIIK
jgi:hypothetical protein